MPDPRPKADEIGRLLAEASPTDYAWLCKIALARRDSARQELAWAEALYSALTPPTASPGRAADCPPGDEPAEAAAPRQEHEAPAAKPARQSLPGEAAVIDATVEIFVAAGITTDEAALGRTDTAFKITNHLGLKADVITADKYLERVGGALSRENRRPNPRIVNVGTPHFARYRLPTAGERGAGAAVHGSDDNSHHDNAAMAAHEAADHGIAGHRQGRHAPRQSTRAKSH